MTAPLAVGDDAVRATTRPTPDDAGGPSSTTTIMLDQSMPVDEGGKPRLANVVDALKATACGPCRPTRRWDCGRSTASTGRSEVPMGPLSEPLDGQPRSAALTGTWTG